MAKGKKIYFIDPFGGLDIYYTMKPDDFDIASTSSMNIGYNDTYGMRSQYVGKPWFSDNLNDLKNILNERRKKLVAEQYSKMLKIMEISVDNLEPQHVDYFDAPFRKY